MGRRRTFAAEPDSNGRSLSDTRIRNRLYHPVSVRVRCRVLRWLDPDHLMSGS